jgi:DNA-binding XRE family transcriptional regulator
MGAAQTILTEGGEELVVLSRRDYDVLRARAGDPASEDAMTAHILAAAHAAASISTVQPLALDVWEALEKPENQEFGARLALLRMARGLTRDQLADVAGLDTGAITALEAGEEVNSKTLSGRLAQVLAVELETLTG